MDGTKISARYEQKSVKVIMSGKHMAIVIQMIPNHAVRSLARRIPFFSEILSWGIMFLYMIVDHHTNKLFNDDMIAAKMHANHNQVNTLLGMIFCINENIAVFGSIHLMLIEAINHKKIMITIKNNRNGIDR